MTDVSPAVEADDTIDAMEAGEADSERDTHVSGLASRRGLPKSYLDHITNLETHQFREQLADLAHAQQDDNFHTSGATISWRDVSFSIVEPGSKETRVILEPCSGTVAPGQLVAMMGPSGCGKSTLLDMLADKKTAPYQGEIFLNGRPRDEFYKLATAYVPQVDEIFPYLTVREAINFVSDCRLPKPKGATNKQWHAFSDLLIEELGLETVKDTRIGNNEIRGISGGQKRRVSLAKGLMTGAFVVFADEPTSGLSSTDTNLAVRLLKLMAVRYNITFFIVIHQPKPEVAQIFDELILMTSQPGRVVYQGPMAEMTEYYAKAGVPVPPYVNPADFCLDMVSPTFPGNRAEDLVAVWRTAGGGEETMRAQMEKAVSTHGKTAEMLLLEQKQKIKARCHLELPAVQKVDKVIYKFTFGGRYSAPVSTQLRLLWNREILLAARDPSRVIGFFVMSIVTAIFLGLAYFQNGQAEPVNQLGSLATILQIAFISTLLTVPGEDEPRTIVKLEAEDQLYSLSLYVLVRIVVQFLYSSLSGLLYYIISFSLLQLPWDFFGWFLLFGFLMRWAVEAMVLSTPAIGKNAADGQTKLILLILTVFLFNGLAANFNNVPVWMTWGLYISPAYWAIEGLAVSLYDDGSEAGAELIDFYGFVTGRVQWAIVFLVLYHLLFRAIHIWAYVRLWRPQK